MIAKSGNRLLRLPDYPITRLSNYQMSSSSSASAAPDAGRTRTLRRGGGIGELAPLIERQMMSFNSTSGARSSTEKSIASDAAAPNEAGRFFSSVGTRGVRRWYVAMFGVPVNALYSGAAAASYWLIGVSPRISSIVRSTDDVEYSV